jgi:hypothetical protein
MKKYYQYGLTDEERLVDPNYKGRWMGDVDDYNLLMIWTAKKDGMITLEEAKNALPQETEQTVRAVLNHYGTCIQSFSHEDLENYGRKGVASPIQRMPGLGGYFSLTSPWDMKTLRQAPTFNEKWSIRTNPATSSWIKPTWKYHYRPQD